MGLIGELATPVKLPLGRLGRRDTGPAAVKSLRQGLRPMEVGGLRQKKNN